MKRESRKWTINCLQVVQRSQIRLDLFGLKGSCSHSLYIPRGTCSECFVLNPFVKEGGDRGVVDFYFSQQYYLQRTVCLGGFSHAWLNGTTFRQAGKIFFTCHTK